MSKKKIKLLDLMEGNAYFRALALDLNKLIVYGFMLFLSLWFSLKSIVITFIIINIVALIFNSYKYNKWLNKFTKI